MNKKKKMLLMVSLLAITSVLFGILIYSSKSDSKNINSEVSLRANADDVSLDDMMNTKNGSSTLTQSEALPSENIPMASTVSEDNPEAIQQVQELIRRNQENINGGQEMITHERNRVYTPEYEGGSSEQHQSTSPTLAIPKPKKEQTKDTVVVNVEQPRSVFHSVSFGGGQSRNAIKAYVHSDQIVMEGSTLKMRLAEDCVTDNGITIPKSSPIFGEVKSINGERVIVDIKYINYNGNILPFKKKVYSRDALAGIYAPGNAKSEINKDVTEGAVDGLPSSVALDPSLQLATTLATSAVSAGKGAVSKATRKIKVLIKTNYELYLRPDEN